MDFDPQTMQSAILTGLPIYTRWMVNGTPVDYDFSEGRRGGQVPSDDIIESNPECHDFLIFGRYDCAEGGGASPWLCIRKTDCSVIGLDFEREDAVFAINSSLERFVRTFAFLNSYLGAGKQLPFDAEKSLREIDPGLYPVSDWRLLVNCLTVTR
jgi:hypothetical protein